jgi:hypothetical protein
LKKWRKHQFESKLEAAPIEPTEKLEEWFFPYVMFFLLFNNNKTFFSRLFDTFQVQKHRKTEII